MYVVIVARVRTALTGGDVRVEEVESGYQWLKGPNACVSEALEQNKRS